MRPALPEQKVCSHPPPPKKKTVHKCFKAVLFKIGRNWKQHIHTSYSEYKRKINLQYVRKVDYYLAVVADELIHTTWMPLTYTFLGDGIQTPKGNILYDSIDIAFWKRQNYRNSKQIDGTRVMDT